MLRDSRVLHLMVIGAGITLWVLSTSAWSRETNNRSVQITASVASPPPMFKLNRVDYREADLPDTLKQALYNAQLDFYKKQIKIINAAVLSLELERKARESGRTKEAVANELLAASIPDDADIEIYYESNKGRIGYPLDMVRDQLREMLVQRERQAKQAEIIAETKRNQSFELALSRPVAPVVKIETEGFPSKGNPDAKVTIVEFADYQCPHCKNAANALGQIAKRHSDDVRVVFMDFPVNRSGISRTVAEGAACADQQGQFWPYHDLAFEQQQNLSHDSALRFVRELGMDVDVFKACLKSQFPRDRIARSEGEASRLGVSSTPTLFLNNRQLHLHDFQTELSEAVKEAVAGGGS